MRSELSQSVALKCTPIRTKIIAQKYDAALFTNVLRWNKDCVKVMQLRAEALLRNGKSNNAIKHQQQVLRKDPDNTDARRLFKHFTVKKAGNVAFKADAPDEAIQRYSACLRLDVTNRAAAWLKQKEFISLDVRVYELGVVSLARHQKVYGRRIQALYELDHYESVGRGARAQTGAVEAGADHERGHEPEGEGDQGGDAVAP